MYCTSCGKELTGTPEFCTNCGVKLNTDLNPTPTPTPTSTTNVIPSAQAGGKNKTVSIVLAVFLSFFTWLYTFKKDSRKFWIGLGLIILAIILGTATFGTITAIISFGTWLWALIDTVKKDSQWYSSY